MRKLKKILLGATLFVTMSMLTACGSNDGNNAADEVPRMEENAGDEREPGVTDVPEEDRNNGTSENDNGSAGANGEYSGTVEYDTNGTTGDSMNDSGSGNASNNNSSGNNGSSNNNSSSDNGNGNNSTGDSGNGNNNDGTVSGELGSGVESLGEGVGDAVRDVGDAVGNAMDGENNNSNSNNR